MSNTLNPQGYETALREYLTGHFADAVNFPWGRDYGLTPEQSADIIRRVAVEVLGVDCSKGD